MQTGSEPQQFQLSGKCEPKTAKCEVFVPLTLLHSSIIVPEEQRLRSNS